ncbi:hypothetical protein [Pseudonocardia sp.]|uniref:hypothetical protein n=1 Tax=Pseudonocardia sp. TaxID=60912 RepID=UPI003453945A
MRVFSGVDPATGRKSYLAASVRGVDRAAYRAADKELTRLLSQVDQQRNVASSVGFAEATEEWLPTTELEESSRRTYRGYLDRTLIPALGDTPLRTIDPRILEQLYVDLRRCRHRCTPTRRTNRERRGTAGNALPTPRHTCSPLAASTVRQMHWIVSGTMGTAVRWGWLGRDGGRGVSRRWPVARRRRSRPGGDLVVWSYPPNGPCSSSTEAELAPVGAAAEHNAARIITWRWR